MTQSSGREDYRILFDEHPLPLLVFDRGSRRILEANRAATEQYGYTREDFRSMRIEELCPPEDVDAALKELARSRTAADHCGEWRHRTRSGTTLQVEVIAHDLSFAGRPARLLLLNDVTARRDATREMRLRGWKFETLAENTPDLIARFDPELRYLYVNRATAEAAGLAPESFLGKTNRELGLASVLVEPWDEALRTVFRTAEETVLDFAYPTLGGRRWYQARIVPERGADAAVTSVLSIARDVTEARETKQALEQSEAYFRSLIEHAQDLALVLNTDGTIRFVSPSIRTLCRFSPEETQGKNILDLVHPNDQEKIRRLVQEAEPEAGEVASFTYRMLHNDGGWRVMEATGKNLSDDPAVNGVVVNARDITSRVQAETAEVILHEMDRRILEAAAPDSVLQFTCEQLAENFGFGLVWIGTKEADGSVDIRARAGRAAEYLDGAVIRWDDSAEGRGPAGTALRTNEAAVVDVETDPSFQPWRSRARDHGLYTVAAVPLYAQDRTFGLLALYADRPGAFEPKRMQMWKGFAAQVALSIVQAEHQERIRIETAALESAANATIITDRRGVIQWVNPAFTRLTGYTAEDAVGRQPDILKSGVQNRAFYRELWRTILRGETWRGELYNRKKNGSLYISEQTITPVRNEAGEITHFVAIQQDVTDRKRQEERIRYLAMHDPLTDLPNRRTMEERLANAIARARRGHPAALLLMDLDNFKAINDTVGHPAGDQFLIRLSPVLRGALRPTDVLARFGGDEFAALLEDVSAESARAIAERLRDQVSEFRFHEGGYTFAPTISVGIALIDGSQEHPAAVLTLADAALHAAKDSGKNRVMLYRSLTDKEARLTRASQWAVRIKDALRDDGFVLHFQPIISLINGHAEYYEALIRMKDDDGEPVEPAAFITAAERFGLTAPIDGWVVDQVLSVLEDRPNLAVCVNISGASLGDASLLRHIEDRIRRSRITPGQLIFEITETEAVQDLERSRRWMRRLKELGCGFALDDFGIGFSSFSYLRTFPADHVKIDGSFIKGLHTDPASRAIVQGITMVAHALGKGVIAEWVEDEEVTGVLRELGVDYGQGFFWGQPAPALPTPRPAPRPATEPPATEPPASD